MNDGIWGEEISERAQTSIVTRHQTDTVNNGSKYKVWGLEIGEGLDSYQVVLQCHQAGTGVKAVG